MLALARFDGSFVAGLCAKDWGLWRTCVGSIERLQANLESSPLDPGEASRVQARLEALRGYLEAEPKTMKWRLRSQVGDKVRWYQQPDGQEGAGVFADRLADVIETRACRPELVAEAAARRPRAPSFLSPGGTLVLVAADHPARGTLRAG